MIMGKKQKKRKPFKEIVAIKHIVEIVAIKHIVGDLKWKRKREEMM